MFTHPRIVLIADEDRTLHSIVSARLAPDGFFVRHAAHWVTALKFAREIPPRVIVLDYHMQYLDLGLFMDTVRTLKSPPEVVLIGEDDEEFGKKIAGFGLEHYIPKPVNFDVLTSVIRKFGEWTPWYNRRTAKVRVRDSRDIEAAFAAGQ